MLDLCRWTETIIMMTVSRFYGLYMTVDIPDKNAPYDCGVVNHLGLLPHAKPTTNLLEYPWNFPIQGT
jgi:hypothetical protein